ncbi:hypothetical protein EV424DRAFT_949716 [Suillus variegatus]|nr:hypothetical protein EV424DRAFT_949716 [Suillus variegatus]
MLVSLACILSASALGLPHFFLWFRDTGTVIPGGKLRSTNILKLVTGYSFQLLHSIGDPLSLLQILPDFEVTSDCIYFFAPSDMGLCAHFPLLLICDRSERCDRHLFRCDSEEDTSYVLGMHNSRHSTIMLMHQSIWQFPDKWGY